VQERERALARLRHGIELRERTCQRERIGGLFISMPVIIVSMIIVSVIVVRMIVVSMVVMTIRVVSLLVVALVFFVLVFGGVCLFVRPLHVLFCVIHIRGFIEVTCGVLDARIL
jgi:hypothetical protein